MAPHGTVYMVVREGANGLGTPRDLRGQGGISNHRLPAPGEEALAAEWQRLRNIRPDHSETDIEFQDLMEITMNVIGDEASARRSAWAHIDPRSDSPAQRAWIVEIATSPNILMMSRARQNAGVAYLALGGMVWSQVVRFTEISPSQTGIREPIATLREDDAFYPGWMNAVQLTWMTNLDYNRAWETYGATQGLMTGVFDNPPQGTSRAQLARDLVSAVTSSQLIREQPRRQRLRELLDWDIDREPHRDFPLLRTAQPPRLDASALPLIDWARVQIPPDVQIALASGLATAVQCTSALQPFRDFFLNKGPRKSKREERKDDDACSQLSGLIKENKNIPSACHKVKNIELYIALSDKFMEGTWDNVGGTLEGPAGKAEFFFAKAPDAGTRKTISVDMKKYFGSDEIDISGIDKMTLNAQAIFWESWTSLRNDEFTVKDVTIRAQCSDPAFKAQDNKYVGINKSYHHPGKESFIWDFFGEYKQKTVGTLKISPSDWSFTPPCTVIKDLKYHFKIASALGGGTFDKIFFTLGEGKQIPLGSNVKDGFSKEDSINLKEIFGKDTIDILDLKKIAVGDDLADSFLLKGDKWNFQGITFSATCADISKKMEMKKFGSVGIEVQHKNNAPAWTGDISPQDWLEVA
ncbi:hypothetical protein QQS21_010791 [Conoideocrella luteorostrata]|uniref:Uncharacterized protein n=1 Tax=Conoideocrella luteorostrata TaxID=1105319 RepID=A0AAJ0CIS8_9HYPO|nr:hypothetical protein QQS21_010791 [Conoideocrella luteorostrata]